MGGGALFTFSFLCYSGRKDCGLHLAAPPHPFCGGYEPDRSFWLDCCHPAQAAQWLSLYREKGEVTTPGGLKRNLPLDLAISSTAFNLLLSAFPPFLTRRSWDSLAGALGRLMS